MKLSKIAWLAKEGEMLEVNRVGENGEIWVRTLRGIYRLNGFPKAANRNEMAALLGIKESAMADIHYEEYAGKELRDLYGNDLRDTVPGEFYANALDVGILINGYEYKLLAVDDIDTIEAIRADDLAPLADEFAKSGYMGYFWREWAGNGCIVVKDGFSVRCAIAPLGRDAKESMSNDLLEVIAGMKGEKV